MKFYCKPLLVLALAITLCVSCNDTNSTKALSKDTSEKKFNPAGEQKQGDTYDPKQTATDTMYKNRDSLPK